MPRFKVFFSALLLLFWWLIPLNALAVTEYTWIYAGDGNWNEATKWSGGIVPGVPGNSAHQVWIDSSPGANVSVYVNVSPSISGLKLDMGDNLYVNSNYGLNLSQDDLGKNPTVSNQGTIHVSSSGSLIASAAQVTLTGSGSVVMHGSNAGLTQSGSGSFINDSDLTIRGSGGIYAPITNRGSIIAENGILTLSSTGVINQGVMTTSGSGSTLKFTGTITNENAINASTGNFLELNGTNVTGGQINPNGGTVNFKNGNSNLYGVSLGAGTYNVGTSTYWKGATALAEGSELNVNNVYLHLVRDGGNASSNAAYLQADTGAAVLLTGSGSLVMGKTGAYGTGLTYSGTGSSFINDTDYTIRGTGSIQAPITNKGSIIADNGLLTVSGAITGSGRVAVTDGGALTLKANLETGDFSMSPLASLTVASSQTLSLFRDFTFAQANETLWNWGTNSTLQMKGGGPLQALEVGGEDEGAVPAGFTGNFDLVKLSLTGTNTYAYLANSADNQPGAAEALYVDSLLASPGTTLNLNNLHLYTMLGGSRHLVLAGEGDSFGGGLIINEAQAVPLPGAVWLLGFGLLGLGLRRFWRS